MIRRFAKPIVVGLFLFGLAEIQAAPQRDDESWYQTRESFYKAEGWKMRFFDRIRDDLNRVLEVTFSGADEYRLAKTKTELGDLQTKLASSAYDEPELDSVIGALGKVVADNRLLPRDREMLKDDLTRLRDYREHHEGWR